jgi:uncharacterized integral membrane protein
MKLPLYLIGLLALLLLVVTFTLQNTTIVEVKFVNFEFQSSLAMILFLFFSAGILFTVLIVTPVLISRQRLVNKLKNEIETTNAEKLEATNE